MLPIGLKIFFIMIPAMIALLTLHLSSYYQLYESLKRRNESVDDLKLGFSDFGSGGCIRKLNMIEKRFKDRELSGSEKTLINRSKIYYYLSGIGVLFFLIGVIQILFNIFLP